MTTTYGHLNPCIRYLVKRVNACPKMSLQIYVKVGSRDESDNISGISHLLEHMFFQGSTAYPSTQTLETRIYECGGTFNAFTGLSETVFHIECASECVEKACDIASSALYHSLLDRETFRNEQKVVLNELRESLSNPRERCRIGLQETTFEGTRLAKNIGGSPSSVNSLKVETLAQFLRTYYGHKDQIIVSLTSSLSLERGEELLTRYFSEVPHYEGPPIAIVSRDRRRVLYPKHFRRKKGCRVRYTRENSPHSFIGISYPACAYKDTETRVAMNLISEILTGYMGADLYQKLRNEKGLVYHIDSHVECLEELGVFEIHCSTSNARLSVLETIGTILGCVESLADTITQGDLDLAISHRVRQRRLEAKHVHKRGFEATRDLLYLGHVPSESQVRKTLQSITIDTIRNLSRKTFREKNCCISYTGAEAYL